eukprot:CAMPEP_0113723622 /NCGR_PEP_ID=MMETSP0038_2-20120614/38543_1 /TAXON_ID=2898 /ORGANISM="Cryptomonas paramecium" /LENGTH=32 /DNA_ID=CAMNT_0000653267 /DNA_START=133 /DNA_END=227 /DNA_ORIENTATION=+ /assembly_acc=CAM_ASM_000170
MSPSRPLAMETKASRSRATIAAAAAQASEPLP